MTKQRYDSHSTEFGLWLRQQQEIDSALGYVTSNLDYIWHNYRTGEWMLIEEKRHCGRVKRYQRKLFELIDRVALADPAYRGLHVIIFENTSPADGRIWLDNAEINVQRLMRFLQFKGEGP